MHHDAKRGCDGRVNVTSMVDVMLMLLIIFMVVTPALLGDTHPAGPDAVPIAQGGLPGRIHLKGWLDAPDRTTLGIDNQGNYYLNSKPIAKANALVLLEAEFARHPDDRVLFVRADRNLRFSQLAEAMRVARAAGARVSALVTEYDPNAPGRQDKSGPK